MKSGPVGRPPFGAAVSHRVGRSECDSRRGGARGGSLACHQVRRPRRWTERDGERVNRDRRSWGCGTVKVRGVVAHDRTTVGNRDPACRVRARCEIGGPSPGRAAPWPLFAAHFQAKRLCVPSALDIRAIYEHDGATHPPRVEGVTTPPPVREAASAFFCPLVFPQPGCPLCGALGGIGGLQEDSIRALL